MAEVVLTFSSSPGSGEIGESFTPFADVTCVVPDTVAKLFYKVLVFRLDSGALVPEKSIEDFVDMGIVAPSEGTLVDALAAWEHTPVFGDVEIYVVADDDPGAVPPEVDPAETIQQDYSIIYPMALGYEFKSNGPMRIKRNSTQFKTIQLSMTCGADPQDLEWDIVILKHTDLSFPRRSSQNFRGVIVEEFSADVYSGLNMNLADVTPEDLVVQHNGLEAGVLIDTESTLFAAYDIFYLQATVVIIGEAVARQISSKLFPIILSDEVDRVE